MGFELTSNLDPEASIPLEYYGNQFGYAEKKLSPLLEWRNAPKGTKSFAITLFDLGAPTDSGFWHYLLINIPAEIRRVELGALSKGDLPEGAIEIRNDAGIPGFLGPCTPPGREHRYKYTVHALKTEKLDLPAHATPAFTSFNLWANRLDRASFTVKAGRTS